MLLIVLAGCSRSPNPQSTVARASVPRVLEVSAMYEMPPGSYTGYTVREAHGRVEGYSYNLLDSTKHFPFKGDPRLARFIDRVDSLITYRLPSDTNRAPPTGHADICGDGFSLGARLTIGSTARTVGTESCGDRSPGAGRRFRVLVGIVDSLQRLARP